MMGSALWTVEIENAMTLRSYPSTPLKRALAPSQPVGTLALFAKHYHPRDSCSPPQPFHIPASRNSCSNIAMPGPC